MAPDKFTFDSKDFVLPEQLTGLPLLEAVAIINSFGKWSCRLTFQGVVEHSTVLASRVILQGQISGPIHTITQKSTPTGMQTVCEVDLLTHIKGADMPTAETVPPQYNPGDVVATSDGVEWLIAAIKGTEADLVRFKGPSHDRVTRPLTGLKLLRKGDLRPGRPSLSVLKQSNYWWVQSKEDNVLSMHNIKVDGDRAFYDYAPFTPNSFHPLTSMHATASYCPANAAGVPLPWSSLDVAAPQPQSAAQPSTAMKDVEFRDSPIATGRLDLIETHFRVNGGKWQFEESRGAHWLSISEEGIPLFTFTRGKLPTVRATGSGGVETMRQRPVLDDGTPVTWTSLERAKVVNVGDTVVCSEFVGTEELNFNPLMKKDCGKELVVLDSLDRVTTTTDGNTWGTWMWPIEAIRVVRRAAKKSLTAAATSDTVTKSPITTAQIKEVKETTMPPTTAPSQTPADTLSSRFVAALKEGAKRAPVEAGIDKGHEMLKELLISAVGAEGPREEGIIREYVTRLLSSNYGKAIGAYAVGELLHTVAPHLGKRAALAQAAGREFSFRAATIAEKEAGSSIIALFPKGISMLDDLLNSFASSDEGVEVAAVQPQQLSGSTGELSRVMAAAVGGVGAEKATV